MRKIDLAIVADIRQARRRHRDQPAPGMIDAATAQLRKGLFHMRPHEAGNVCGRRRRVALAAAEQQAASADSRNS